MHVNGLILQMQMDILRCGADNLYRPQNSQTQSQFVWYSHNTRRLCFPLGAATREMDAEALRSLMHHNKEQSIVQLAFN